MDVIKSVIETTIKQEAPLLKSVSKEIWENPELKFEEIKAHRLLTKILKAKGFGVQEGYVIPTAFRAEFASGRPGPTVALICEYDALPGVGHACGHNLIAEAGLGAGLALKAALESGTEACGKVVLLGTPAEEGGGGKILLIRAGAFKDIDVALMAHPSPHDHLLPPFIACGRVTVTYTGKETHACGYPWEGRNALDAAVASYNNISLLRQHIKPTCKLHGVITNGGLVPNVIPALAEVKYMYRAATTKDMEDLKEKLEACCIAAAKATGCGIQMKYDDASYNAVIHNKILSDLLKKYAEPKGIVFQDANHKIIPFMASTDMGNVSHVVPSIHPTYCIGTDAPNHSAEFKEASGKDAAQQPTLIISECMALIGGELMCNPKMLEAAKEQFQDDIAADAV